MPVTGRPEPVLILDAIKALLALAVVLGWVTLSDVQVQVIISAAGAVLALVLTLVTRARVTPVSDPVDPSGALLVPVEDLLKGTG